MTRARIAAALTATALAAASVAAPAATAATTPKPAMLIVAVHPDDENTLSTQWTNRPGDTLNDDGPDCE